MQLLHEIRWSGRLLPNVLGMPVESRLKPSNQNLKKKKMFWGFSGKLIMDWKLDMVIALYLSKKNTFLKRCIVKNIEDLL